MDILKEKYSITELSERLSITDHALRYYEKEFNINIPKDERGRRYYTPEYANLMYQIKNMRDEGLEIKAIKKVLLSEGLIFEPSPMLVENTDVTVIQPPKPVYSPDMAEIKEFFNEIKEQLAVSVSEEVTSAREHITKELTKTKLELGACVENGMRKLESKMDKHFQEVDRSLGLWRERNNSNPLKRLFRSIK